MRRTPVVSSNVRSIGWEDDTLEVEFHSGSVYQYEGVPQSVYQDFLRAPSIGRYLNQFIIPRYSGSEV